MSAPCAYLLDANERSTRVERRTRSADESDSTTRRAIVCAACGARISDTNARIEVSGQHQHTFFNPAGIVFKVACFATAPGCRGVGPFVQEFSWFPGTFWQVAVCATCIEHLGWHFEGDGTFVGLIEDRIREASDE